MPTIMRKFSFDYGHRVLKHESKCKHLHGHLGIAEVSVWAPALDSLGRVIDFSVLKNLIGSWIDNNWDHNILLHKDDPLLEAADILDTLDDGYREIGEGIFAGKSPYITESNPTAENLAKELYCVCRALLPEPLKVTHVRFWETPNCCADYSEEPQPV